MKKAIRVRLRWPDGSTSSVYWRWYKKGLRDLGEGEATHRAVLEARGTDCEVLGASPVDLDAETMESAGVGLDEAADEFFRSMPKVPKMGSGR